VDELGLSLGALRIWPEADVGAARLKAFEVGAGGDFAVELLAGQPDLFAEEKPVSPAQRRTRR
jgi:hypothetical protein